tara:strand:- start:4151 stop:5176 length:1026 start_codon:yes stop_codon:yes gene_type:complete
MNDYASEFSINGCLIGMNHPVYIIAEAGISHFGDENKAYRLVDLAVESGADAVKFQIYDVDAMISKVSADWKTRLGSRQLDYAAFERIQKYCDNKNITFFATAHDQPSLDFLVSLNVPAYKIGSGEVGNWPFIETVANLGKPLIFSTGMYKIEQISEALEIISGTNNKDIGVLHCVTEYPAPVKDISLKNINLIAKNFDVISGYSDHTEGYHIPLAAIAMGAKIIEKHISLDFNVPNAQDWKVSCGPHDLALFIKQARDIEAALSLREDGPTKGERDSLIWASKSLIAKKNIETGSVISIEDLVSKRPGTGISPSMIMDLVGRTAKKNIQIDEVIKWEFLS